MIRAFPLIGRAPRRWQPRVGLLAAWMLAFAASPAQALPATAGEPAVAHEAAAVTPVGEGAPGAETLPAEGAPASAETPPSAGSPASVETPPAAGTPASEETPPGGGTSASGETPPAAGSSASAETPPPAGAPASAETSPGAEPPASAETSPGAGTSASAETPPAAGSSASAETSPGAEAPASAETSPGAGTSASVETSPGAEPPASAETSPGAGTPASAETPPGAGTSASAETPPAAEAPASAETPPSEPDPLADSDLGSAEAPAVPVEIDRALERDQRPQVVIKTILGLIALLALAYLGGHPRMRRIEQRLRISQVVTAGFPFVALGVVAALPSVGVLTHSVLDDLTPLLRFGLGWIGFVTGHRFETRSFDGLPKGTASAVGFATAMPFLTVVTAASVLLLFSSEWSETTFHDPVFLRDALILGTAGAMTARTAARLVSGVSNGNFSRVRLARIIQLEEFAGIAGLAFIAAYFRPTGPDIGWQLPGTAWLFLTIGLGATIGILAYVLLRRPASGAESVVLLLGTVAFASGLASALHLSPIVVCFVAGVLLANFPSDSKAKLGEALGRLERPIYLLFLVMVGAILEIDDWRGWVLGAVFVVARLVGKWLSANFIARYTDFDAHADENWLASRGPIGQLAIAIVVSAQLLFPEGSIPIIVTAVLMGAIVTEILVQILARGGGSPKSGIANLSDGEVSAPADPDSEGGGEAPVAAAGEESR